MLFFKVLFLSILYVKSESTSILPNVNSPKFDACENSCSLFKKDVCRIGCLFAHFIAEDPSFGPKDLCSLACRDRYSDADDVNVCENGCTYYPNGKDDDNLVNLKLIRIKIGPISELGSMLPSFFQQLLGDGQPTDEKLQLSEINPNSLFINPIPVEKELPIKASLCHRIGNALREMASDPLRLLLAITVVILFIALVTQVVVYCVRRNKRNYGYQYTALPSYAEAIDVKAPLMEDENNEKIEKMKSTKTPDVCDA